ncbi:MULTISPECIES: LysR family transcriptional regulator [Ramlibacter]|uniref:LysR family transcriptional regulator n=1 Tax=Ramlibacter aquaticus TaxID=2780094 RepID=A0ABR9SJE2_9BURK|nr:MULTISPECIES: LysR family transcriptional regulator [Ramlibacter]MBE7942269.1 LysR family transcriptional regulator [Ramlibacter aquaticus]
MQLQHLVLLDLVVSRGSFSVAATAGGITQPAVSQAMQGLEQALGLKLFEKSGRHKVPTAAGLQLARLAKQFGASVEQLKGSPDQRPGAARARRHSLHVGMAAAASFLYGACVERAWHAHMPDGLVRFAAGSAAQLLAGLESGELDLVVVPRPRMFEAVGLREVVVHISSPAVYVRKGHPLAGASSLAQIQGQAWVVAGLAGTSGNVVEEAYAVRGLGAPRIVAQGGDYATVLRIVAQSDLMCVVPHPALLDTMQPGAVVPLRLQEGLPRYEVCLYSPERPRGRRAAATEAVIEAVIAQAGATDAAQKAKPRRRTVRA